MLQNKLAKAEMLLTCIRVLSGSNPGREPTIQAEDFRGFPQSF
jgi:hypothetical protein